MNQRFLIAAALLLAAAGPMSAQQLEHHPQPRSLSVTGTGTVQRQPDRAVVLIAVESRASTAQQAAGDNARKMDAIYAALRRLGIVPPKVATISYELQPQYNQPDPRGGEHTPRITGYIAINMVRAEVDSVPRAGAVIDAGIAAGANRIANLSFELRDMESARLEALRIAVQRARAEAEAIAAAAGQRLGPPLSISSSHWQPRPMFRRDMMAAEAAGMAPPPTPVEAGNLTIQATVNINYELADR
ncbi:MAG: SIMPL domain-containing protein [Gemmatimonadota bacterium]